MLKPDRSGKRLKAKTTLPSRKRKDAYYIAIQALEEFVCTGCSLMELQEKYEISYQTINKYINRYYGITNRSINLESRINDGE